MAEVPRELAVTEIATFGNFRICYVVRRSTRWRISSMDRSFLFIKETLSFDKRAKVSLLFLRFVKSYYKFYALAVGRLIAETILLFKI